LFSPAERDFCLLGEKYFGKTETAAGNRERFPVRQTKLAAARILPELRPRCPGNAVPAMKSFLRETLCTPLLHALVRNANRYWGHFPAIEALRKKLTVL
jgi:hypothetical protein